MAGMILPVLEITSYSETPSFAVTVLPSMVNSIVAASTSGFVAGFNPIVFLLFHSLYMRRGLGIQRARVNEGLLRPRVARAQEYLARWPHLSHSPMTMS